MCIETKRAPMKQSATMVRLWRTSSGGHLWLSVLLVLGLSIASMPRAHAEWAELLKDEDITYVWDKDSVRAVHVSRIAWTMTNLSGKGTKAPNGEEYQSSQARWRINCKTDSFVKLSESFYAKPDGKVREVAFYESADWRPRDAAIKIGRAHV